MSRLVLPKRLSLQSHLSLTPEAGGGASGPAAIVAQMFQTLQAAPVWGKMTAFWFAAQPTVALALQNSKNPGTFDMAVSGVQPAFTPYQGWTSDGVTESLLGPTFTALAAGGMTLNNVSSGVFSLSTTQTAAIGLAASNAASIPYGFQSSDSSRNAGIRSASTTTDLLPAANSGICHVAFSRLASGSYAAYIDRMKTTVSTQSTNLPSSPQITQFKANTTFGAGKIAALWIGIGITDADYATLDQAIATCLQQLGAYTVTRGIDGAWTWFNDPRVIPVLGVPVIGCITSNGSVNVNRQNAATTLDERAILHEILLNDDHCNPGLFRSSVTGKIIAAYNKHNDVSQFSRISNNVDDVSTFAAEVDLAAQLAGPAATSNFAYANFQELTGDVPSGPATNFTFFSNALASGNWTLDNVSCTVGQVDPFGGTTASLVTSNGAVSTHRLISTDTLTAFVSGNSYASSWYIKPGTQQFLQITWPTSAFGAAKYATFDTVALALVPGSTVGCTGYIYPVGNGWYRIVAVATATASAAGSSAVIAASDGSNAKAPSFAASGTFTAVQAQVEAGTLASPPIITAGATVTRPSTTTKLWQFFRATTSLIWTLHYSTSIDGGSTWVPATRLLWDGRPYWKSRSNGAGRIDIVCNDENPGDGTYPYCNTYHFYYQNGHFFTSFGVDMGSPPFTQLQPTVIWDSISSGIESWVWDLQVDPNGNPYCTFATFPTNLTHQYYQARWNGSTWLVNHVTDAGGYIYAGQPQYSGGIVNDPQDINTVYCSRQVDAQGNAVPIGGVFQLFKYHTADNGVTWTGTQLTFGTLHCLRPYIGIGGIRQLYYMIGTYAAYTSYNTLVQSMSI